MTGYTVHTGSTVKFSSGWDRIFEGSGSSAARPAKKSKAKLASAKKKAAKKATAKKVKRGK